MKHLKKFENFTINEELMDIMFYPGKDYVGDMAKLYSDIWDNVKDTVVKWKEEKCKDIAKYVSDKIEKMKDNPAVKEALANLELEWKKLSDGDKQKASLIATSGPKLGEMSQMESFGDIVKQVLRYSGLGSALLSFITGVVKLAEAMNMIDAGILVTTISIPAIGPVATTTFVLIWLFIMIVGFSLYFGLQSEN